MSNNKRTKKIHKKKTEANEEPRNNIFLKSIFKSLDQDTAELIHELISAPEVMKLNDDELYRFLCPNNERLKNQ
jgi:hypothetical protein